MKKNIFSMFIEKILAFPLWVKQIIYLRLYQDLALNLSEDFIQTKPENIFHLYIPPLTFAGKTELEQRQKGCDRTIYTFLENVAAGLNMLEISMNNFWTMEEVAKNYIFCLENDFLKTPDSVYIHAMAGFMSGKFRTGEYFKRIGKINVDQLEQVLIKQKECAQAGTPMKMAEVMISLNYITEKDTQSLLKLKEEAKKRFILDMGIIPKQVETPQAPQNNANEQKYKEQIAKLVEQNTLLKDKLRQILAHIKK